ncbi:MCE family protein [Pseudonocardiaceae bacterium YIM PH 21723]|nr:MCE family protein [Pseudonocardiaceae bacterium YIM PH 21723]
MLTRAVRIRLLAFLVVGLTTIAFVGLRYAALGPLVGLPGHYEVTVALARSGGLFAGSEVTFRGVHVGKVAGLSLVDSGVRAHLEIDHAAPAIPAATRAVVTNRSAVGEQYLDLQPAEDSGPYLADGSTISEAQTETPLPVQDVLSNLDTLVDSVPPDALRTVIGELGTATRGQAENLQALLDAGHDFTQAADENLPQTVDLLNSGQIVLRTQQDSSTSLLQFAQNAQQFAETLRQSDADLRGVVTAAPGLAEQVTAGLRETNPGLAILLANLTTTAKIGETRQAGLGQFLTQVPLAVDVVTKVFRGNDNTLGLAPTFFNPPPCTKGYLNPYRNGTDLGPQRPLNVESRCQAPPGSGINVRGSQNAPWGGGVPEPVAPRPLDSALALPVLPPASGGLAGLLGVR